MVLSPLFLLFVWGGRRGLSPLPSLWGVLLWPGGLRPRVCVPWLSVAPFVCLRVALVGVWGGWRESNPHLPPWRGGALPSLSYIRSALQPLLVEARGVGRLFVGFVYECTRGALFSPTPRCCNIGHVLVLVLSLIVGRAWMVKPVP